jgi:hypothetical protein
MSSQLLVNIVRKRSVYSEWRRRRRRRRRVSLLTVFCCGDWWEGIIILGKREREIFWCGYGYDGLPLWKCVRGLRIVVFFFFFFFALLEVKGLVF